MTDQWLWVIGGGLLQIPLIEEAHQMDLNVLVTDMNPSCPASHHADRFEVADIFAIEDHIQLCKRLIDEGLQIAGVLAAGIDAPETMARVNEFLGLKGVSAMTARTIQQKDLFRQAMQQKGYPVPRFSVVTVPDEVGDAIESIGFPLIVKPPANSASRDMKIFFVNDYAECVRFVERLLGSYNRILLEELWTGPEQTVECLVDIEGEFHEGFITDRQFIFDNGFPVETGLVHPTELTEEEQQQLFKLARDLAKDFEITAGAVKLDTVLTEDGPRLIEMTVRHSGGFDCQYLVPLSTGKNIVRAAIYTAVQKKFPPELLQPRWEKYGVTGSIWPEPGYIESIDGLDETRKIPGVEHVFLRYDQGNVVEQYVDCAKRAAFLICVTDSREASRNCLQLAQSTLRINTV